MVVGTLVVQQLILRIGEHAGGCHSCQVTLPTPTPEDCVPLGEDVVATPTLPGM